MSEKPHKCAECGLLGQFDEYTRQPKIVDQNTRKTGLDVQNSGTHTARIFCQKTVWKPLDNPTPQEVVDLIHRVRKCDVFRKWEPSKTPKEHEEMGIVEQVRNETQAALQAEKKQQEDWRREDNHWKIVHLILTVLAVIAAIVSAISSAK